ncbi:hypothetical protein ASD24_15085 [Paenibacillus sp. Root52]|nr:hypothetical protein ASD24_15085 [Paenibacillus sp. Root52]
MRNYIIPSRLYQRMTSGNDIQLLSRNYLPIPYDHRAIIVHSRKKSTSSASNPRKHPTKLNNKIINFYENKFAYFAGFEAASLYGFDLVQDFFQVDEYVYTGMEKMTNQQFDNFSDLSQKIGEYQHSFWTGMSEQGISKIAGHIGEVYAADHLETAGVSVEWPDASNQIGWDLLVGGHEVNVKLVSEYSSLGEHFAKYPDIPVLVPGDMANLPENTIYLNTTDGIDQMMTALSSGQEHLVIVDSALNNADVISQTERATDLLLGSPDIIGSHLPVLTILLSGWREASLLAEGKTEITHSLKNISLDTAGTGVGGAAGAKAGAVIGSAIGPVGTAVGAVVGGISGAVFGRFVSNKVKRAPYKSAIERYETEAEKLNTLVNEETENLAKDIERVTTAKQKEIKLTVLREQARLREDFERVRQENRMELEIPIGQVVEIIQAAVNEINFLQENVKIRIMKIPWFRRQFLPSRRQLAMELAIKRLHTAKQSLQRYQSKLQSKTTVKRNELYTILAGYGVQHAQTTHHIQSIEDKRMQREETLRTTVFNSQERIIGKRVGCLRDLAKSIVKAKQDVQLKLNPTMEHVKQLADIVKSEANKLGAN